MGIELKETDINNVFIVKTDKGNPIKLEFVSYLKKSVIFKNIGKLKGTKIFIANDLCLEDRATQSILQQHLKHARSNNYCAKIKGQTLIVNGEVYTAQQLQKQIPQNTETETTTDISTSASTTLQVNSAPFTPRSVIDTNKVFEFEEKPLDTAQALVSPDLPPAKKHKTLGIGESRDSGKCYLEQRKTRAQRVIEKLAPVTNN